MLNTTPPQNTRLLGIQRGEEIEDYLQQFKYLTATHVAKLVYTKLKPESALRKARQKLQDMFEAGKIQRFREEVYQNYVYYVGKRSSHARSFLTIADFYVELTHRSQNWQGILDFKREKRLNFPDTTYIVADAEIRYKITLDKAITFLVEVETTNHDFIRKVRNYAKLAEQTNQNLSVVVITSPRRKEAILKRIEQANDTLKVRYAVISLMDMKLDYMCWAKGLSTYGQGNASMQVHREGTKQGSGTEGTSRLGGVESGNAPKQTRTLAPHEPEGTKRPNPPTESPFNRGPQKS